MTSKPVKAKTGISADASASGRPRRGSRALGALVRVSEMVAGTLERDTVLDAAMEAAAEAMNAEACSILLRDADTGELCFHIVKGNRTEGLEAARMCVDDESIAGWVAGHQQPLLVPDVYDDPRFNPAYDKKTGFRSRSVICVPLCARGSELGVIQVWNRRDGEAFDAADLELSEAVADLIALAVHTAEEHEARLHAERVATVGQTIAGLAHFIKNILNGLQGGSYIIDQNLEKGEPEKAKQGWDMVKRNMGLLSNVVLDMLSYTRNRKPAFKPVVVGDVLSDVVALLKDQAAAAGVTVANEPADDVGEAEIDEASIKRCLINLVGNAIDACKDSKGTVTLSTRADDDGRFSMSVRDTGCGMPPEVVRKIFDPFFSTKGGKGTGLGLAVTKKVVDEHSGKLDVKSTPGEGTTFIIELPLKQDTH